MKNLFAAGLALSTLLVGPALAADMPVKARAVASPVYSWTGCYVGTLVGGGWGRVNDQMTGRLNGAPSQGAQGGSGPFPINGYMTGAELGCNYQTGNFVIGLEGDWSWAYKAGSQGEAPPNTKTDMFDAREKWFGTARGRVGYAVNNFMLYATGGAAWANLELTDRNASNTVIFATQNATYSGWTAGGGFELGLPEYKSLLPFLGDGRMSFKAEYLYADLGSKTYFSTAPNSFETNVHLVQHMVRFGLNYRFGAGPTAVVARY
jgi:outer membrane immunogenic protein